MRNFRTSELATALAPLKRQRIRYALYGEADRPLVTFANGLTQHADLWTTHARKLAERGYRVLAYDMLGQCDSTKHVLGTKLSDHADLLLALLDHVEAPHTHLAGISFGGVVALDFAIRHGERLSSLAVMSTFAELTPQLEYFGEVLCDGLVHAGLPYLENLLYPMNMSSAWLRAHRKSVPRPRRSARPGNDLEALQNLIESFADFTPLTPKLPGIRCPVLIMNGEYDFFTPRECHEVMRRNLPNCRLLLIQRAYHAFTLEFPEITLRQLFEFVRAVDTRQWIGDGTVWIAAECPEATPHMSACAGDHMRAIPLREAAAPAATQFAPSAH